MSRKFKLCGVLRGAFNFARMVPLVSVAGWSLLGIGFGGARADGVSDALGRPSTEIILQGFNWESYGNDEGWFNVIHRLAPEIGKAGFTLVWFPPVSRSIEDRDGPSYGRNIVDSRGYLPVDYYDYTSRYGTEGELAAAVYQLRQYGVDAMADIVINHVGEFSRNSLGEWTPFRQSWGGEAICSTDRYFGGSGKPDSGKDFGPGADLDLSQRFVREAVLEWLTDLRQRFGFVGWRFDFAKGYSGRYVGEFVRASGAEIAIGENWMDMDYSCNGLCYDQNAHRQFTVDWIDSTWKGSGESSESAAHAFDFTLKGILQEAVRYREYWRLRDINGRQPGVSGVWPEMAVTFIDNHDTGSTQGYWPFGGASAVMQGYAYILTHPGIPSIFWDHFFDWGLKQEIRNLIEIRRRNHITAKSQLSIAVAENGLYAAFVDDQVAVKLGSRSWAPGMGWEQVASGENYAVWQRR
jgi:alpha-amylase